MAQFLKASDEELKILNPIYSRNIIPGPGETFTVRIPLEMMGEFLAHESEMRGFKPELTPEIKYEPDPIFYRVKSGDVLGTIAQKHGVSVRKLKDWNGLKNSRINIGQRLVIHGDPSKI
jgi:membrane-bound lytic murein transglycosylase D